MRRAAALNIGNVRASKVPDDVHLLKQLFNHGIIVSTPAQDYDDSYTINYARQRNGYVISNDMYRDQIERFEGKVDKKQLKAWSAKYHISSYVLDFN